MPAQRVALPGSDRHELQPHIPHPRCHPDERIEASLVTSAHLTDDEFGLIDSFASEHGLVVVSHERARRRVVLSGRTAAFESAFGVELEHRDDDCGTYCSHYGPLTVPAAIEPLVEGVFGLDTRPVAKPHFRKMSRDKRIAFAPRCHTRVLSEKMMDPEKGDWRTDLTLEQQGDILAEAGTEYYAAFRKPPGTFTPLDLAKLYDFPAGDGSGQCIGIIELDGGYSTRDLRAYFAETGSPMPNVSTVSVDHGRNRTGSDADGEVMLDIEVAGAIAPHARIVVYFAPNTDQGFLDAITMATHDRHNKPSILSISWGGPETYWSQAAMASMNKALQAAAQANITTLVASGDNGSDDGVGDGQDHVDFPASSPWVTACGGTKLVIKNGVLHESVWNEQESGEGAGGGGISGVFPVPDWQQGHVAPGALGRGVPDVSAVADPVTGYCVRVDGQDQVIGGTSAVAPLLAGLVARLNQRKGKPVGFWNPALYAHSSTIRDIVDGNNGTYAAGPGWDAASGLGVIDGSKLAGVL